MKPLLQSLVGLGIVLASAVAAGAGEISPAITVNNRITAKGSIRGYILNGKKLYGVNVTDGACAPRDPSRAASLLASFGVNWVRLHHIDRGLREGWWSVGGILNFMDALYANGIRVSVDGTSKLGEIYPSGQEGFKRDLYAGNRNAEKLYAENLDRIKPLLRHRACFMVCLVNEGAHMTSPSQARRFWQRWSPRFRSVNSDLLISDCPDAASEQGERFQQYRQLAKSYDVVLCHYYNSDGSAQGHGNNIFDGWNWYSVLNFGKGLHKPVMIQEFGSYRSNEHQGSNLAFVHYESIRRNFSTCEFSFASNEDGWHGGGGDPFTICNDPLRLHLLTMGAYLYKNARKPFDVHWSADTEGKWGNEYHFQANGIAGNDQRLKVGSYVWTWDKTRPSAWISRANS
jgi:hypothetical protein